VNQILKDLSAPNLVTVLENNMFAFFTNYAHGAGCELYSGSNLVRFATGVVFPFFNGVVHTQLQPEQIDNTIITTLDYFRTKQLPMLWWTGTGTQPADLAKHLAAHGLNSLGVLPVMAIDLSALPEQKSSTDNLSIIPVRDQQSLRHWVEIAAIAFQVPRTQWDAFFNLELSLGWDSERYIRFIGYANNLPVATSALYLDGQVAGIYVVATAPEARKRGFATAITLAALEKAHALGYHVGTLQASQMGVNVYRQMGFQEYSQVDMYVFMPVDS